MIVGCNKLIKFLESKRAMTPSQKARKMIFAQVCKFDDRSKLRTIGPPEPLLEMDLTPFFRGNPKTSGFFPSVSNPK
jgi:hypothetical protein